MHDSEDSAGPDHSGRIDTSQENWWEHASVATARSEFRETLAEGDATPGDITLSWLKYWAVANTRGLTRGPALALALHLESALKKNGSLDDLAPPDPGMSPGFCRFFVRGLMALAEQPGISLIRLTRMEHAITSFAARAELGEVDAAAIRLALDPPLGREPLEEDVRTLREFWERHQKGDSSPGEESSEANSSAFCQAALGQILVESLLRQKETGSALAMARQAIEQNPCWSGCALAPQGLLSACLEPWREIGEESLAAAWERKLAQAAPPSHTWMAPAGARTRYLARSGRGDEARRLIEDTASFTGSLQTSAWQRLQFFSGAADALAEIGPKAEFIIWHERAGELAAAFDQRNSNQMVSNRLGLNV